MSVDIKTPPHSVEAERGVIGAILIDAQVGEDSRVLDLCQSRSITEESFYDPKLNLIYKTLVSMSNRMMKVDATTLIEELRREDKLEAVGGAVFIQSLIDCTPVSAHAEYYIDIVAQKHHLRKMINCANDIIAGCYDPDRNSNAELLQGEVEKNVLSLGSLHRDGEDWKAAVTKTLTQIENTFNKGAGVFEGLPTGFKYIDEKLLGLKPSEMIVIAARPSVGKTSFAMNIAECVAMGQTINGQPSKSDGGKRHPVLIFSLEMDQLSLCKRMMCGRARVSSWKIARDLLAKEEKVQASARLFRAADELSHAPIYIDESSGLDISDLRARARRMKKQYGIELVVIDYLQLCNCREFAKQGRQIETSRISGQIKAMAKELHIPVIVLSQLSRANEKRGDQNEVPKLSDLRDSGAIEQDADVVMLLRRPSMILATRTDESLKNVAYVDIAKHRNGETGDVMMRFDREWTRFGDQDPVKKDGSNVAPSEAQINAAMAEDVPEVPSSDNPEMMQPDLSMI